MNIDVDEIIYRVLNAGGLWAFWNNTTEDTQNAIRAELLQAILDSVSTNPLTSHQTLDP